MNNLRENFLERTKVICNLSNVYSYISYISVMIVG